MFDYNTTFKNYSICEDLLGDFASKALVPQLSEISDFLNGYCNNFKLKLTSEGFLDYATFSYDLNNGFAVESAQVRLTITDIGTTVLPHNLVVE